jgi:HK97 family phage major capsid protein
MQTEENDLQATDAGTQTRADAIAAEQALADFARSQQLSRKNAAQLIFGHEHADPKGKSFGDWLVCVRKNDWRTLERKYQSFPTDGKAALTTSVGSHGGYLVPTEFTDKLLQAAGEKAVVRPRATLIPMASRAVQVPCLDCTSTPASTDSAFLGGIVARWTEESATLVETEPVFRQVELVAHELSGYSRVSNSLLEDSAIGLEQLLITLFGRAIAWHEDHAFLRGDGVGKPLGILNSNALVSVTRSAASAFELQDAATMLARLMPGWAPETTVWAMHPAVAGELFQMTSAGAGSSAIYLDNARNKPAMVLFGIPVVITEKLPGLNTLGDVLLLDLQHYLVGDRREIEIAFSEHVAFTSNQGAWRFVARVDGQPWLRAPITLNDGSSTLSPFIGLAAG